MALVVKSIGTANHAAQTGTLDAASAGATVLAGSGTAFTTDFTTDDRLIIDHGANGLHSYDITAIGSDTSITISGGLRYNISAGTTPYKQGTLRVYSTITAWEAASYGATASDDAQGECYNDSAFDESLVINDATPLSVKLTVPTGERHDGTAGTGARIVYTADGGIDIPSSSMTGDVTIEWLEIDMNGKRPTAGARGVIANNEASINLTVQRLIVCRVDNNGSTTSRSGIYDNRGTNAIHNNIFYDFNIDAGGASRTMYAIESLTSAAPLVQNNTIFDITAQNGGSATIRGIHLRDVAGEVVRNNVVTSVSGAGTSECYNSIATATASHNLATDNTDPGANSLGQDDGVVVGNQFVSTTPGSEDLHLKAGADAIDAADDRGTTPTGINIDINNRDRDAQGDVWDMGAHEFVAAGGGDSFPGYNRRLRPQTYLRM